MLFYYGMRQRGCSPGCQPKDGLLERQDDPRGRYWDILKYNRRLSHKEERNYDLDFIKSEVGE